MQAKSGRKNRMVIAFDLDDTLIPCEHSFATEKLGFWARRLARERLRLGTARVLGTLQGRGWDIWVYTTSFRSPFAIRLLFLAYGVRLRGVVNQTRHQRTISRSGRPYQVCSKYPPAFGIDVLVDKSEGVSIEARRFGFPVVRVLPDDSRWADRLMDDLDNLLASGSLPCPGLLTV
jgi:hypothetical protein